MPPIVTAPKWKPHFWIHALSLFKPAAPTIEEHPI
jgi:hypothetical protein